ncbi:hypothetical protein B0H12DRAFT_1239867 [Mycena haematopus]|nr:hypothetical protein B0H12DRAFT_1239867 [Mycena haematopus]
MPDPALFDYTLLDFSIPPLSQGAGVGNGVPGGDWGLAPFGDLGAGGDWGLSPFGGLGSVRNASDALSNGPTGVLINLTNTGDAAPAVHLTDGAPASKRKRTQDENNTQDENDAAASAGGVPAALKKPRKTRCDKGVRRGPRTGARD